MLAIANQIIRQYTRDIYVTINEKNMVQLINFIIIYYRLFIIMDFQ